MSVENKETQDILEYLKSGNKRFSQGKSIHPNSDVKTRKDLIEGQKPIAVVLSCSDSRVPVEMIFDVGLGELFVIRSAGHVLSEETLGSVDYAINCLGVRHIIIMGHENCGAVTSAMKSIKDANYGNYKNAQILLNHIKPTILAHPEMSVNDISREYIKTQKACMSKRAPELADKLEKHELVVEGAYYNMQTGIVEFFE